MIKEKLQLCILYLWDLIQDTQDKVALPLKPGKYALTEQLRMQFDLLVNSGI